MTKCALGWTIVAFCRLFGLFAFGMFAMLVFRGFQPHPDEMIAWLGVLFPILWLPECLPILYTWTAGEKL